MSDRSAALFSTPGTDFAAALATPPLPNLRRIGGEMFAWSDRDPERGPALPRGAVLRFLLGQVGGSGRTVLVAGPHADELVASLADAGAQVTWLLRSLGDAEHAAATHPGITVLAGAIGKLDPGTRFDLVVAADGVDRLNSAEGEQLPAAELIDRLVAALAPDGALVLTHDNLFGLQHTVRLEPGPRPDAAWYPADVHDDRRPASQEQLAARLTGAGLVVDAAYAAFPDPSAPTVLVGSGPLGDMSSPLRPWLAAALSQAFTAAFRRRPVLTDPRRLMARALRAGAEGTVAAAWLLVARAPGAGATPLRRHDVLIGDAEGTYAYELVRDGIGVRTSVLCPAEPLERAGLRRIAEPVALGAGAGYLLEERLLHLCAGYDLPALRTELGRFEAWLRGQAADGALTGPAALTGVADVLVTEAGPVRLPARWEPVEPVPLRTALVRAVWRFAVQLITAGHPHPWPVTSSAVDLTAVLLGMVGHRIDAADVRAAVQLEVAVETADHQLGLGEQGERVRHLLAVSPGTAPVDAEGYRELTEALWRQRYQASHLLAMMEWTEQIISSRDNTLSKLDWEIQFYRRSWAGRFLMVGRTGYRMLRRDGRKVVRRVLGRG
ncbi:hypothetical protein [Jidongwangia harbinensis]|uniref:hypothetical protein n=1 Tax=Jidongwangia harbinensis TaxID=2878561 RepID=UPI001CD9B02B|nr:hypothetical protein [Jidongwangia harbinensis]MCA2214428.1 hypothetical protein [Jidongwangia harbinensis]